MVAMRRTNGLYEDETMRVIEVETGGKGEKEKGEK